MALFKSASSSICYEADISIFFCYCIRSQGLGSHLLGSRCALNDCGAYTCASTPSTLDPPVNSRFPDNCHWVQRFYESSQERHPLRTWEQFSRCRPFRSRSCFAIVVVCLGSMSSALRNRRRPHQAIAERHANLQRIRPRYLHAGQDGCFL
jgi:hypothetical protein